MARSAPPAMVWLVLLSLMSPSAARADGFRNPFQSAAAVGQGNAFAAQADDASAIFYNPAGMAQLRGVHQLAGVELVNVHTRFRSSTGETTENDLGGPFGFPPPAQLFLTATPRDLGLPWLGDLAVGIGLQNLFGFATRYPENGPLRTAVTSASLPLLDIKPTVDYRLTDWLSLGVGADIFTFWSEVGEGHAEQKFVSPGLPGIPAGGRVEINGRGSAAGLNAGALLTLLRTESGNPRVNVGLVWRSQTDLPLDGDFRVDGIRVAGAHTSLRLPESWTVGLAVWPWRDENREWKIEADMDYVRWSSISNFDVRLSNRAVLRNPQDWSNAVTVGVGTEYKWLRWRPLPAWDLALRTGYLWSMTPIPDQNFNPAFPDSNVHMLSLGVGLTCRPGGTFLGLKDCGQPGGAASHRQTIGLDVAYHLLLFETRTVTENPNPAVNGRYRTTNQALVLSFRLAF